MRPRALILRTAGTNCDKETEFAFRAAGAETDLVHLNAVKERKDISSYRLLCIPGGFSYGDDLGAGKIFSLELLLWFQEALLRFIEQGGLILGICNGFQVLAKTGILPDAGFAQTMTLAMNDSCRFEDRWTYLSLPKGKSPGKDLWAKGMPEVISLPVAHGEGKFYTEQSVLDTIERKSQVLFRYSDECGNVGGYPFNPNGSLNNIAGITDPSGRVLGLMPHPERCMFLHQYPFWREKQCPAWGFKIFENAVQYCKR
jgi:phosphoribosylformylglycinamidine synthase I